MKKLNLLTRTLLLFALMVGSTSVWADDYYVKITTADEINTNSTYIIVAEGANKALGTWTSGKQIPSVDVTISSSAITVASSAENKPQELVLEEVTVSNTKYHVIKHANEVKYLQGASSAVDLKAADSYNTDASKWTIGITSSEARIFNKKQTSNAIIYREGSYYYFKNFASSNVNNTEYYYGVLYKKVVPVTPAKTYTTLTSANALDFTNVSNLKAYIATEVDGGNVNMTQVNKVPASTGLVLKAETTGSAINIPVYTGTTDDVSGNQMAGSATETTAIAADGGYILKDGVFQPASAGTLPAGKAYLAIAVSGGAHPLEMNFEEGDVTGISEIKRMRAGENKTIYNLAGQRVNANHKGIVVVNGKKFVNK